MWNVNEQGVKEFAKGLLSAPGVQIGAYDRATEQEDMYFALHEHKWACLSFSTTLQSLLTRLVLAAPPPSKAISSGYRKIPLAKSKWRMKVISGYLLCLAPASSRLSPTPLCPLLLLQDCR